MLKALERHGLTRESLMEVETEDEGPELDLSPIVEAIKGIKFEAPEPVSNTKELAAIAAAVAKVKGADGLAESLNKVAQAIAAIHVPTTDLAPLIKAIEANTKAQQDVAKAIKAPRQLVFDEDGQPTGTK